MRLHCALRGDVESPLALPQIAWRSGLDIELVDLNDPERARWLMAGIWPDHLGPPDAARSSNSIMEAGRSASPAWRPDRTTFLRCLRKSLLTRRWSSFTPPFCRM